MLVAQRQTGELISLLEANELKHLQLLRKQETFYCPACGKEVTMKLGQHRRWHFSHLHHHICPYELEPETAYHQQGKTDLYHWLRNQNKIVLLEHYIPELKQRPDLLITSPHKHAIEFQCATIPSQIIKRRQLGFHRLAMSSLWILGAHRLKRESQFVFKLHDMDWHAIQPLTPSYYAIYYYCPIQKRIIKLSKLIPLTKTKVMATIQVIPLKDYSYHQLFIQEPASDFDLSTWLIQKKRWRLTAFLEHSPAHKYVNKMYYAHGLSLSQFPPFVGLPLSQNILIRTPSYLWQSWIVFRFFSHQSPQHSVSLHKITQEFKNMFKKHVFEINSFVTNPQSIELCVKEYLSVLCQFKVIYKRGMDYHRVHIEQESNMIEDLLLEDKTLLKILLN